MLNIVRFVRRVRPALAAVVAAGSLAGCQQQAELPGSVDAAASRAAIDKLRTQYENAVAAGDLDAMSASLAEGALMIRPGGPEWDSMSAAASGAPFPPGATIDITPIEVVVLNKEWAYEFGTAMTTYTPEGGGQRPAAAGHVSHPAAKHRRRMESVSRGREFLASTERLAAAVALLVRSASARWNHVGNGAAIAASLPLL